MVTRLLVVGLALTACASTVAESVRRPPITHVRQLPTIQRLQCENSSADLVRVTFERAQRPFALILAAQTRRFVLLDTTLNDPESPVWLGRLNESGDLLVQRVFTYAEFQHAVPIPCAWLTGEQEMADPR
jgi:hypothetical protein